MKKLMLLLIVVVAVETVNAQKVAYTSKGKRETFNYEDLDITFTESGLTVAKHENALLGLLPTAVDIGFNVVQKALERRAKKFVAEYTKQKSVVPLKANKIPNFTLTRKIGEKASPETKVFEMEFKAKEVTRAQGSTTSFVYYVSSIALVKSAAKATARHNTFDYTIDLKVVMLVDGEKKVQELAPITISSVDFNNPAFPEDKHRTDLILVPEGAEVTEIAIKVVESNPVKVRSEKILEFWNDNKDNIKTIINNILPKTKDDKGGKQSSTTSSPDTSISN